MMPKAQYISNLDTLKQKLHIDSVLGSIKASQYFDLVKRFFSLKVHKRDFDRLCIDTIGRENVHLHNHFIMSILKACLPNTALPTQTALEGSLNEKTPIGCNNPQILCKDRLPRPTAIEASLNAKTPNGCNNFKTLLKDRLPSIRKCRTPNLRGHRVKISPSPLGLPGKSSRLPIPMEDGRQVDKDCEILAINVGSSLPISVKDGDHVDKDCEILAITKSPIPEPLAIPTYNGKARNGLHKRIRSDTVTDTCQSTGQLPDTQCLTKRLKKNVETEGLEISADAADLLNKALDVYLKRLIKPCLNLAASKSVKKSSYPIRYGFSDLPRSKFASSSVSDFKTAIELNPTILGENWPQHFEKICLRVSEQ